MGTLTAKEVAKHIRDGSDGWFGDGDGLFLHVVDGAATWKYRFQIAGKRRTMGLGSARDLTLAEARERHQEARKLAKAGTDPIEAAKAGKPKKPQTFAELAQQYIEAHRTGWRNAKHGAQWTATIDTYVNPKIGEKLPADISTADVLAVLTPIWQTVPETASRVRSRIELILDAAAAHGLREGANPARWRGHLDKLLPRRPKASKRHHPALPYRRMPEFWQAINAHGDLSALALQMVILTACRTGEVLYARWSEIDREARIWTIPGARMKAAVPHRVPLSDAMMALLDRIPRLSEEYLFPALQGRKRPVLSDMALTERLKGMHEASLKAGGRGWTDAAGERITTHGFRSCFKDWCAECTHYPNIISEQALAHTIGNAVESAYRRGDLLEKRRALMADWSDYVTTKPAANVVPINRSTTAA